MCIIALTEYLQLGFRRLVGEVFPPPPFFNSKSKCIACPRTENYMLVGTAFDYLFRSELKRLHPDAIEDRLLVGEKSVELVRKGIERDGYYKARNWVLLREDLGIMEEAATRWRNLREEFLKTGDLTDEFLEATLSFARLDELFRSGYYRNPTKEIDRRDVEDLRRLYEIIPEDVKNHAKSVILNPDLSNSFVCADADLILDNRLIDIKTTKHFRLPLDYWAQIVGYLVLARRKGIKLNRVGIYFSRYGKLWTVDVGPREKEALSRIEQTLWAGLPETRLSLPFN